MVIIVLFNVRYYHFYTNIAQKNYKHKNSKTTNTRKLKLFDMNIHFLLPLARLENFFYIIIIIRSCFCLGDTKLVLYKKVWIIENFK